MTHPERERWIDYVYNEAGASARRDLEEHLASCEECRRQVAAWRQTMDLLDECSEPAPVRAARMARLAPVVRWAMAAAVLLLLGYVAGRVSAPGEQDLAAIRADMAAARQEIKEEVLTQVRKEMDDKALATLAAGQSMTDERLAEVAASFDVAHRSDMLTLAALTERELVRTQQQIAALAYEQAAGEAGDVRPMGETPSGGG